MEAKQPSKVSTHRVPTNRYAIFGLLSIGGTAIDLISKEWVFGWRGPPGMMPIWWLMEPFIGIETAVNQGALFGIGQGKGWLFAILSVVASVGIYVWLFQFQAAISKWLTISMGLVMGGIFGNLYDRLGVPNLPDGYRGGVRDWILLRYQDWSWPNFNIADSLLVVGAIMLAVHSLFLSPKHETKPVPTESQPSLETQGK